MIYKDRLQTNLLQLIRAHVKFRMVFYNVFYNFNSD